MEVFARWTASITFRATALPRQTEHILALTWSCKTCLALVLYIFSRTKANRHYTGTHTGEARCAVARAEQAKIGLLTFPQIGHMLVDNLPPWIFSF